MAVTVSVGIGLGVGIAVAGSGVKVAEGVGITGVVTGVLHPARKRKTNIAFVNRMCVILRFIIT